MGQKLLFNDFDIHFGGFYFAPYLHRHSNTFLLLTDEIERHIGAERTDLISSAIHDDITWRIGRTTDDTRSLGNGNGLGLRDRVTRFKLIGEFHIFPAAHQNQQEEKYKFIPHHSLSRRF